jgi:aminopyrrolnitrin oxygenase
VVAAPSARQFPAFAAAWYVFCSAHELKRGPISRDVVGRRLVAFLTRSGRIGALDAHCAHFGADLGRGRVIGEVLQCPFHHWEYQPNGVCTQIPAGAAIPAGARQMNYPAVERHGLVFFFNGPEPLYPLPFFAACDPHEFRAARPFETVLECPWYLVGANHFDLQHFLAAHDRRLLGEPFISCPGPFTRQARGDFLVAGRGVQDRFTRWSCGPHVTMEITDWSGTLMFTTARFRRACSYGMTAVEPLGRDRTLVRVVVFVRRSRRLLGRVLLDPGRLWIRRLFIKRFLEADRALLQGIRYSPNGLTSVDAELAAYLRWLASVACGHPQSACLEPDVDNRSDADASSPSRLDGARTACASDKGGWR